MSRADGLKMRWAGHVICDKPGHRIEKRSDSNGKICRTCKAAYTREYKKRRAEIKVQQFLYEKGKPQ